MRAAPVVAAAGGAGGGGATGGGKAGGKGGGGGGKDITKRFQEKAEQDALQFMRGMIETGYGGILETLGIGDVFPDLSQTPLAKSVIGAA